MKATKLLLILLSCMLIIGCKKNKTEEEITPPASQEQQYPTITMDTLKHYFPYQVGDRLIFDESGGFLAVTYTISETTFASKDNKMIANIIMEGIMPDYNVQFKVHIAAEVTDQHMLKSTFSVAIGQSQAKKESFEYDTAEKGALPVKFNYSDGAVVEKDKGLTHFVDELGNGWDFFHIYKQ